MKHWNKRFLASTRGRVVQLLRRGEASVNELAGALGLTANAIRAHLSTLERDGLVQQAGRRPAVRKPESLYALTPQAEYLFPKAYSLLLNLLLDGLGERMTRDHVDTLLREIGGRVAAASSQEAQGDDLRTRATRALDVLGDLGGLAELEEHDGRFTICGLSCPLADATAGHPEVCLLAESMLAEVVGAPVQQKCVHNGAPHCVFEIG